MSKYAVIVENDESDWDDVSGDLYHFPNKYKNILTPGCKVVYYKSKMQNKKYVSSRLSKEPHYFGIGVIGNSIEDTNAKKGKNWYCEILGFQPFENAIPIKVNDSYLESIPSSKSTNYWRDGVREITQDTYDKILNIAETKEREFKLPSIKGEFESENSSPIEGTKKTRYTAYYERHPIYRQQALDIHGYNCKACGFNFEKAYGNLGKDFIHVHHIKPVSESGPITINPVTDLIPLCPNCHSMVHRDKKHTLSVQDLMDIIETRKHSDH